MKTYTVYRICSVTRRKVTIVTLGERRRQGRGSNAEDMMRLVKRLCTSTKGGPERIEAALGKGLR